MRFIDIGKPRLGPVSTPAPVAREVGAAERRPRCGVLIMALMCIIPLSVAQEARKPSYADVSAIFQRHCVLCHAGENAPAGLRLDSFENVLKGSANRPVVLAGRPDESELLRRVKGVTTPRMPMTGPPYLSDAEIARLEAWVVGGLVPGDSGQPAKAEVRSDTGALKSQWVTYSDVAPIFAKRCVKCHMDGGLLGAPPEGFRLNSYQATLDVRERARVVPGHPDASELVRRIRGQAWPRMPHDGPPYLLDEEIALIQRWVEQGARDSSGQVASIPAGTRIRLRGTLNDDGTLDGLALRGTGGKRRIRPGAHVEVRGSVDANGVVTAGRIRER
jgi:mono/diheme cytochrome c family protein